MKRISDLSVDSAGPTCIANRGGTASDGAEVGCGGSLALVGAGGTDHESIHMHGFVGIAGRNREGFRVCAANGRQVVFDEQAALGIPQFVFAIILKI